MKVFIPLLLIVISAFSGNAQTTVNSNVKDERALYAETKQVNQFFRRFNNEESVDGTRLYDKDKDYRDLKNRQKYLKMLFDSQNPKLTQTLINSFISDINDKDKPLFLDFHGGNWFAQLSAKFLWKGKEEVATLFLELEDERLGSKWIIKKVSFLPFNKMFEKDTSSTGGKYFLHPLSHELDFMNLNKAIKNNKDVIENYASKDFKPDHLTMFLHEIKKGNLQFVTVSSLRFHFFQIDKWYFELSEFNRAGNNSGWLISGLTKLNNIKEKEVLLQHILNRNE